MTVDRTSANVALLAAQAAFFGVTSALLVIPANGIFLAAYGAEWLPLTYIGIAILGAGISILIARALRRWTLPTVSVAVLVAVTATLIASWAVIAATGSAWPSVVQLILFPVLLQLGFVIIGGQAGRLLDLQEIKRFFPRVVAGFVVGFTIGGFAGVPLLDLTGAPEHLVVVSALSCAAFALLVRVTAWRRPAELTIIDQPTDDRPRRSLRSLLTTRFVALVFAYQVLSAMGSQVLDFLVFDRAAARYGDAAELTRFVALYTGVLNVVDLLFLVGLAGLLLWRFGLRLGLLANPVVVTALTVGMLVAVLGPGASSLALFALVVTARIVDIALTDGTTRGSINAVYQVLPVEERLAVQAGVEGIGVPLAIGATGVTLLAMNALDLGTSAIVGFAFVLCGGWSLLAIIVYLDYRRALAARLRRRGLDLRAALPGDDEERSAARRLLLTDDVRDIRLGLDLALIANTSSADLAELEAHEDAVVRVQVSAELARRGDEAARRRGRETVRRLATADDITGRRAAAAALTDLQPPDRQVLLRGLLADAEPAVRVAALEAVAPDDAGLAELVVGALDVPTTVDAALDASRRLGPPAIASAASRLSTPGPVDRRLVRLIAASDATKPEVHTMVAALVTHPDRSVSIAALGAIARAGATVEAPLLDQLLGRDAALSACVLAASTTMTDADAMLLRALDDELQAARERVLAVLAVRHGEDRIGGARRALSSPDGPRRALGVEMLQVSLSRREAALVDPVVRDDLGASERLRRLGAMVEVPQRDRAAWVADLAVDDERRWASPWLQAVALYTELASARAVAARHAGSIAVAADPALAEVVRSTAGLERASAPGDLGPARSASSPAATIRQSSCREPGELLASGLSTVDAWRRRLSRECWDAVWRCDRAARRRRRRLVMGRGSTSPAMFGREAEVAATRRFFARLDAGPAGLVLSGTPGIGKTRLWSDALVAARAAGRRVVTTRPVEADAQLAFAGLRDLVGEAATEVLAALSPPQRHALAVVLLLEEPRAEPGDPAVVAASVVSALRVLRAEGSLVVAVDDAQWLDEPSRAALAFALRRMTDTERVGLLATSRPQGEPVGVLAGALPRDAVERVDVGPLTVAALHRTIVDRFGVVLRRPTLTRLHDMSGGNPLFALEIVRGLGDDAELAVPRDLTALLRARLAALSPRAVEVTMTAAALARPTRTVLERIEGDVDDELEEAVRAEIVEIDSDAVRFAHPLLASVHYAAASPGRRRAAHARIAAAVGDIEERARHLARAARGPDEEVAAVLDEAVAVARRRGALEAAAGLAADAVTMTAPRSTARHRRVLTAVDLAYSSGDSDGAVQLAGAALSADLAPRQRAELLLALGRVEQMRNPRSASATLRAGLEAAADEPPLTAALLAQLAAVEYDLGRPVEALRLAQRAELIAERTGDGSLLALTVGAVSFFESDLSGEIQVARYERAIALEEAAGPSAGEWSAAFDYGQHLLDAWDLEQARPIFERLIARARADGDGSLAEYVDKLAFVELCAGRLADASARAHEAVELASQIGRTTVEVHALFRLGWIEGLRGNVAAAREACGRSLRLAADANGFTRGARLSLGYLESSLENYEAAWAYLDPSDPATGELPPERVVVHVPEAVEVLAALGRSDEARAKLQPFAERSAALDRRWALARAAHCNGLILASEGELEGAVQRLQDAVEQGVANGWPIPLGRALLALGSVQRRRRHKADARRSLQRAVALLDDAGAVIWRDRARRELGRIGGRSAPAGDELSPTEQEIADLVSAGCSNKQVADTLHLSVKTVEWNLSKIFRKLAVRSRAELIARGARAGNPGEPSG